MLNALVILLMTYIASATGMTVPDKLPHIEFTSACAINKLARGMNYNCERLNDPTEERAVAVYHNKRDIIYLNRNINPYGNLYDLSVLLHELVHYMQDQNGLLETYPCRNAAEKLAYNTQIAFLRKAGVKEPLDFIGIAPSNMHRYTTCEMPY